MSLAELTAIEQIEITLNNLGRKFSSYKFIQKHIHRLQELYVGTLSEAVLEAPDEPFQRVHSHLINIMRDSGLVRKSGKVNDADIFGNRRKVSVWERIE